MGASNSVEIPGGGTEGYHVLRVSRFPFVFLRNQFLSTSSLVFLVIITGAKQFAGIASWTRSFL